MQEKVKSKRGRKKLSDGGTSSPREIYCSCAAIVNGKLIHEKVLTTLGNFKNDEELIEEASSIFKNKWGIEPSVLDMTFFQRKGIAAKTSISKEKVELPKFAMEDLVFRPEKAGSAVYKNWSVSVHKLEGNDDVVFINYKNHLTEDKKSKPQSRVVPVSVLENLNF